MQVTNITVRPIPNPQSLNLDRLRGYARIAFDNEIAINEIKIIEAEKGMCIQFPKDKDLQRSNMGSIVLLNREMRIQIQSLVLKAYRLNADYFLIN